MEPTQDSATPWNMPADSLAITAALTQYVLRQISMTAPNIHFIPAPALAATKLGSFEHDVYLPTDDPSGLIVADVRRGALSRL